MAEVSAETIEKVRRVLETNGPQTRTQIADKIGLSTATVANALKALGNAVTRSADYSSNNPAVYSLRDESEPLPETLPVRNEDEQTTLRDEVESLKTDLAAAQQGNLRLREQVNKLARDLNDERQARYNSEVKPSPVWTRQSLEQAGIRVMEEDREKREALEKEVERLKAELATIREERNGYETSSAEYHRLLADALQRLREVADALDNTDAPSTDDAGEPLPLMFRVKWLAEQARLVTDSELEQLLKIAEVERDEARRERDRVMETNVSLAAQAATFQQNLVEYANTITDQVKAINALTDERDRLVAEGNKRESEYVALASEYGSLSQVHDQAAEVLNAEQRAHTRALEESLEAHQEANRLRELLAVIAFVAGAFTQPEKREQALVAIGLLAQAQMD